MTTARTGTTIRLHGLTMVGEDDGVMVGRPDIGSYALFPAEGAEALRMLGAGTPMPAVAAWYERTCGSALDVDDFLEVLEDLRFLRDDGDEESATTPVRWQRLGRWTFSWPAWVCYAALTLAAVTAMVRAPYLRPSYHQMFFTHYLSLIPVVLTAALIPAILLHESFHALAGRRLGLPSTLTISRRFYYLVAETRLDSLFSVPRKKRYLPFLAGILADVVLISVLTLVAAVLHSVRLPYWCAGVCLAIAFTCVLRVIWQFMFYLETDLYFVMSHGFRCPDLQAATRFYIKTRVHRLLRRPPPRTDAEWGERETAIARWYAPLLVIGYGFSLFSLLWAGIPSTIRFASQIIDRFSVSRTPTTGILDALSFILLSAVQWGLVLYVAIRDRRARERAPVEGSLQGEIT
ncbi:MAG TPA: hypothetical protein VKU39_02190 [Streptosporangiaceae bacterium]|nr:hypothetical protein [Streptosporangiaceae bacterium]